MNIANFIQLTGGTERGGSEVIDKYILSHIPQECYDANSTAHYRDMTREELKDMKVIVHRTKEASKDAKAAAQKVADGENDDAQESAASSARARTRSSLTPTRDHNRAKAAGSDDLESDVSSSEQPDRTSGLTNTPLETGRNRSLEVFGADVRNEYGDHTNGALFNRTEDAMATKVSPRKILKSQGWISTAISRRGRARKGSEVSKANPILASGKSSACTSRSAPIASALESLQTTISQHSDGTNHRSSHSKGHHGKAPQESLIISDNQNEPSGATSPNALPVPVLLPGDTDQTVIAPNLQQSAMVSTIDLPNSIRPSSIRSLLPMAATFPTGSEEKVHSGDTIVSADNPVASTAASEAAPLGKKRGSQHITDPENASPAGIPPPPSAENHDLNARDNQSDHIHQSKKRRTQESDLELTADTGKDHTTHESGIFAKIDAYFADQNQRQLEGQYARREEMLQVMLDSGIPSIVAAAHRNKNINPDLHPAYCSIELTNAEAYEMETKLKWLPLNMSNMSQF